jgi:hypothetical protein
MHFFDQKKRKRVLYWGGTTGQERNAEPVLSHKARSGNKLGRYGEILASHYFPWYKSEREEREKRCMGREEEEWCERK